MVQEQDSGLMKVRFSIGAKLITIITFIVLISLGSIIALVSWLVRSDLQIMAEENNFETNRRTAMASESMFENIHSNSLILINTITSPGAAPSLVSNAEDFFFERNPNIAAVFFPAEVRAEVLINEVFFEILAADSALAVSYRDDQEVALQRAAAEETVLLNAAPHFSAPLLALFFPSDFGGCGVLFYPLELNDSFGYGVNQSYLINDSGDILLHADFEMVRNAVNMADRKFTQSIWRNPVRNSQSLYTDEDGVRYFGAYTKLNIAGTVVVTNVEYNKVFEGIAATTRRNLYLTLTVLSISIICIWFFSKSISVPLRALANAANKIEGGSFDVKLEPKGRDEIGILTASFQRMCKALGVFGRFTNRSIALSSMRGDIKPGGSTKNATIFFSDIRDFTAISENFTNTYGDEASDRIVKWLNGYFEKMVECVEKTGGVVDKFIGDAVMAHWGTASTSGSTRKDAYNCIKASIMMRNAIHRMNKERKKDDPENPKIKIGIGINTGLVTAGQIGSDTRMEYTVIGDPVNLASRVEALNKHFATDILITENTWNLVKKRFITQEMPSVKVKGKEDVIRIFAVINYAKNSKGPQTLSRVRRILRIKPADKKKDASEGEKKYKIVGKQDIKPVNQEVNDGNQDEKEQQ